MSPAAPPTVIRARIHESAVKRVTRIYAATLADIFAETLQNSRRAGAAHIRIAVTPSAGPPDGAGETLRTVTITDDGRGIADPAVLLSFGENGWSDDLVRREDAAGFGFASLARHGCIVSSRPHRPEPGALPGWRVELAPEHFLGEAEAEVHADPHAPFPEGTAISFLTAEAPVAIRSAAAHAARHYPLPVVFGDGAEGGPEAPGGELPRRAFLDGAVRSEGWRGLLFGVFRDRHYRYNDPDLNFFGLTLPVGLPAVETVRGHVWTVRADTRDCPDLELVLPARKEAVENDFLKRMRDAARLAIYRAMAHDPDPRPAFADWSRAREASIDIAPPPAILLPWRPSVADDNDWIGTGGPAPAGDGALVMAADPEPPEAQALWRAAERAGLAPRLFEADSRLEGYGWYDGLDRVTAASLWVVEDGEWMAPEDYPLPERPRPGAALLPGRPSALRVDLSVRPASGPVGTLTLPADLAFAGEAWSHIDDALPLVAADSALQPHDLAALLRAAFFSPSDDIDADSRETQRERFDEDALHLATRLLLSDDEACRVSIAEAVRRELSWRCPKDRMVEIRIAGSEISVTLADSNSAAGGA